MKKRIYVAGPMRGLPNFNYPAFQTAAEMRGLRAGRSKTLSKSPSISARQMKSLPTQPSFAAMREALEAARDLLLPQCNGGTAFAKACGETVNKIMDALSAPPRNCDVGTAEEQYARFREHCFSKRCESLITKTTLGSEVAFVWAQMPYEEGGEK